MLTVNYFTFGPAAENTYVLHDETNQCAIIDAGNYTPEEGKILADYIAENKLKPVLLLSTHSHFDHIAGNKFVFETYGLRPIIHTLDLPTLENQARICEMYGFRCDLSPAPERFLEENDIVTFGNTKLKVLFVPGHAAGHIAFYSAENKVVINGDVLFKGTVGRTDILWSNFETLEHSIRTRLYTLPNETLVYCGHGPTTTIGAEKVNNAFVNEED